MGKQLGFDSGSLIWDGDLNGGDHLSWSEADTHKLADFWSKVQFGESLSPADVQDSVDIFVRGIENPITRPDAIGNLMNPQCADLLEDALHQSWTPDLDMDLKDALVEIADIDDPSERTQRLGELVIRELQDGQLPAPLDVDFPGGEGDLPKNMLLRQIMAHIKEGELEVPAKSSDPPSTPFGKAVEAYTKGNMAEAKAVLLSTENPEQVLRDAGPEAWAMLIDFAQSNDPELGDVAFEMLHEQASDILPFLEEVAPGNPVAQEMIEWLQTGERPDIQAVIDYQLSQIASENDVDALKALIEQTPDHKILLQRVVAQGDDIRPTLIEMMGDSDRKTQVFAMDALHGQGDEAMDELLRARAHSDPTISKNADLLIHEHFTGEVDFEIAQFNHDHNPFRINPDLTSGGSDRNIGSTSFSLDVDYFTEKLSNPESCMEALNSLVQAGPPAVPTLCQILVKTRKERSRREYY